MRVCTERGCPRGTPKGQSYCASHRKKPWRNRKPFPERYGMTGWAWQEVRVKIINRQHGRCARCKTKPDKLEVDHINGNTRDNRPRNLKALCVPCHAIKSKGQAQEGRRRYYEKQRAQKRAQERDEQPRSGSVQDADEPAADKAQE